MTETTPTTAPAANQGRSGGGFALLIAAGILLSRVAGLVREKVFAHYFGNSPASGAFKAALRIPNLLQNLFGEGVLSASFIPVYSRLLAEGDEELAGRVAGAIAALLGLVIGVLVLLGVFFTPGLIDVIAPGFHGELRLLTIRLVRVLFPATGLLVMSAWCLGVLNSHRKFFLSYVAPVIWNAAMIATLVYYGGRLDQDRLALALAWGTVAGSALQIVVQLPFVFRYGKRFAFVIATHLEPVRRVIRNTIPVFLGRGAVQVSAYIDVWIASLLGYAAVSGLSYAQTIYLLPISLFGMSIAAAELPQMSGVTGSSDEVAEALRLRLSRALRHVAFFVTPSVVALIAIGDALVAALYQGGQFREGDTRYVWYLLIGSCVGMLAATQARALNSAFYAMHDTKTPLRFALVRIALTALLGYLCAFPLRPAFIALLGLMHLPLPNIPNSVLMMGGVGLTASAGIAGWVEFVLLKWAMKRRIGALESNGALQVKLWIAAILAAVAARLLFPHLPELAHTRSAFLIRGGVVALLFGVTYFVATFALGVAEARATVARFVPALRR